MKFFVAFATVLLAVNGFTLNDHWVSFKSTHGKTYLSSTEEQRRYDIFQNNLKKIKEHNARHAAGLETYTMAVNKYADLTPKEFGAMLKRSNGPRPRLGLSTRVMNLTAPTAVDWREKNAVLEVKDQEQCGSCWAFSTTGSIEGQNAIKNNKRVSLSEQQLVDCDRDFNAGCNGGDMRSAMDYIIANGINSEAEYPYEARNGRCRAKSSSVVKVKSYVALEQSEAALQEAVGNVGPVSVAIYAEPIQFYDGGIFQSASCHNTEEYLDHGVLAVGYGTENGKDFWVVKNSWGADWGEKGFFRLARNANGQCGIHLDNTYPVLA